MKEANSLANPLSKISATRLKAVRRGLRAKGVDGLLVTDLVNIRYLSGFTGSSAYLLVTARSAYFFTDSRYTIQAGKEAPGFIQRLITGPWTMQVAAELKRLGLATLGFEEVDVSYALWRALSRAFRGSGIKLKPLKAMVESVRIQKGFEEVDTIRRAIKVAENAFTNAVRLVKSGISENTISTEIEHFLKKNGLFCPSFDIIVASGPRGALPHGLASDKKIKKGELIVIDMGAVVDGYSSDFTRTVAVGKASKEQRRIYDIVREANERAIKVIRPGAKAREVDLAARDYIEAAGYGELFGHGTGHGVGLNVHEAPSIGPRSEEVLKEGMIITVEPGIYLTGKFGVRIEDMVLVTKSGFEVLTSLDKDLLVL